MIIKELQIKNFGKFSNRSFSFESGLNLVYGENESGKTTLHTFIKSCFYGLRKGRGRAAGKDIYSRYEPWDNPAYYAGNLRFQCDEKTFRLVRDFQNPKNREMLVCETDGEKLSLEHGDLDMLLGDASEVVFENTVFVSQLKSKTDEALAAELKNYIANYQDGDSSVDVQESLKNLKNRKKEQEKKILEAKKREEEKKERLFSRMQYMQEELKKNQTEWRELEEQRRNLEKQGTVLDEELAGKGGKGAAQFGGTGKNGSHSVWGWKVRILAIILLLLAGTGLIWFAYHNGSPSVNLTGFAAMAYVLAAGFFAEGIYRSKKGGSRSCNPNRSSQNKEHIPETYTSEKHISETHIPETYTSKKRMPQKYTPETYREKEMEKEAGKDLGVERESERDSKRSLERVRWKLEYLTQEMREKRLQIANLQEEINAQIDTDDREAKKNLEALNLAAAYIEETVADMQVYVGKRLNERTSEILSELTDGKYTAVELDENLLPAVHTAKHYIPIEQLSRGAMEQVYFALRMAAGDILCQEEQLPVILDDVFAMYDEGRLAKALQWLAGQSRQVLIFTCHKREEELLGRLDISFHKVQM